MDIKPLGTKIFVEEITEFLSPKGIILNNTVDRENYYDETHPKGRVVAVGQGFKAKDGSTHALQVSVGDEILFSKHAGQEVSYQAAKCRAIDENDVIGILKGEK